MKKHVQTDSEWQEEMSQKIIDEIQCELYLDMPFMKLALSALSPKVNEQLYSMATDGTYIYYNPIRLIDIFKKNGMYLNRAYLHSVLHCLFFHLWTKGERDEFLWNTACDIMVEYTIDTMEKESTKRILSYIRKTTYERLKKEHIVIAPGALYAWLYKQYAEIKAEEITDIDDIANTNDKNELALLAREFYTDDHALVAGGEKRQCYATKLIRGSKAVAENIQTDTHGEKPFKGQQIRGRAGNDEGAVREKKQTKLQGVSAQVCSAS